MSNTTTTSSVTKRDLNRTITFTYTLKVPVSFTDFVEFINKYFPEYDEDGDDDGLTIFDDDAKELWGKFIKHAEETKKILPPGRPVGITDENHEAIDPLTHIIKEVIEKSRRK